ncbi:unnamed protein product, partial [marine sediment metagenome]
DDCEDTREGGDIIATQATEVYLGQATTRSLESGKNPTPLHLGHSTASSSSALLILCA